MGNVSYFCKGSIGLLVTEMINFKLIAKNIRSTGCKTEQAFGDGFNCLKIIIMGNI